jgi:hypothetical protein
MILKTRLREEYAQTGGFPVSEPKGRGAAWTEERGTSDEGKTAPQKRPGGEKK